MRFDLDFRPTPSPRRRPVVLRLIALVLALVVGCGLAALAAIPTVRAADFLVTKMGERVRSLSEGIRIRIPEFPERSTIYDSDGNRLATIWLDENRKVVPIRKVSEVAQEAILAAEDSDFYEHHGVDYDAIGRAWLTNVIAGRIEQGASTITQQLARNATPDVGDEDTLQRKLRELFVAVRLERRYTKREILELYLNEVFFGGNAYGIETAAQRYFGVHAAELDLTQSALLAGVIAAPSRFSPFQDPAAARRRRNEVIGQMRELGHISTGEALAARRSPLGFNEEFPPALRRTRAPYFVEFIKREILQDPRFGETRAQRERTLYQGGLRIHTTLDLGLTRRAQEIQRTTLYEPDDPAAALAAVVPGTGAIRVLASKTRFRDQQYDLASQGHRQTGSAFKPFTLVTALEQGISPRRTYSGASPARIPNPGGTPDPWLVPNNEGGGYGTIDLISATANSVNVVFAQLIIDVGVENVIETAHRMGIVSELPAVPSLTLGVAPVTPLEMASAFSTLANGGVHCKPYAVQTVYDRHGEVFFEQRPRCERAVDADVAATAVWMLENVITGGTGGAANIGRPAFGKTGSTNDYGDAWFSGCTPQLCAASWVGHIDATISMSSVHGRTVYGGTFPAEIWHDFMAYAMAGVTVHGWPTPPPITEDRGPRSRFGEGRGQVQIIQGGGSPGGTIVGGDGGGAPPAPPVAPPPKTGGGGKGGGGKG